MINDLDYTIKKRQAELYLKNRREVFMRKHGKRWLRILFGLTLMLGLMLGMTLTAHADGSVSEGCLTFTGQEAFTLSTSVNRKIWDNRMEYSTDTITWNVWDGTTAISSSDTSL